MQNNLNGDLLFKNIYSLVPECKNSWILYIPNKNWDRVEKPPKVPIEPDIKITIYQLYFAYL